VVSEQGKKFAITPDGLDARLTNKTFVATVTR
jgi:hypothetical protein